VVSQQLMTAGPPMQIKLTPTVGPQGLQADGEDVAFIDVEVVDAKGQRVPIDDARIDFTCSGRAIWRGLQQQQSRFDKQFISRYGVRDKSKFRCAQRSQPEPSR
jgi:hypothetical protein